MNTRLAAMIYACAPHAGRIARILDRAGIADWSVLAAVQERRMGFLQCVPPLHTQGCSVIFACAEPDQMRNALDLLATAEGEGDVCPDCVVHTWSVRHARLADVALDVVCDSVVDRTRACTADHNGETYHFCSESCRDAFTRQPEVFVHLSHARKVGNREIATVGVAAAADDSAI